MSPAKKTTGRATKTGASRSNGSRSGTSRSSKSAPQGGIRLDERSRNDILGVVLTVVGIALFIAVLSSDTGFLARLAGDGLRYLLGLGSLIAPTMLVLWGATFFIRGSEVREGRTGLGLGIATLAVISMVALSTPDASADPSLLFDPIDLQALGGYLGSSVAWLVLVSVGKTIGYVLLSGMLVGGLVLAGLSISGLVEWVRDLFVRDERDEVRSVPKTRKTPREARVAIDADGDVQPELPLGDDSGRAGSRRTRVLREDAAEDASARPEKPVVPKGTAPRALEGFELPALSMLKRTPVARSSKASETEFKNTAQLLQDTLETFDVFAKVVGWVVGPTVTMFKVEMPKGVRLNRITNLADDLQLALAAETVRIMAPIPGTSLVGIEIPNLNRTAVTLGDVLADVKGGPLSLGIGKDVGGESVLADLARMPHLLIGGTTGSGKSVAINSMLMSILMRSTPAEVRLILIDPKRVELSLYNGVPHLYVPVVTEPREAASALAWAVTEMERRLRVLQKAGARNIGLYNQAVQDGTAPEGAEELPYLVIVIDELADLMMVAAKEVEDSICRIAQLARAAGIHLIVATQRPEANVVTGLIKANITNRIAFNVASSIDSRVILDQPGAEKLIGQGDMLFSIPEWGKPKRIQGAYVSEPEIEQVVDHLRKQGDPDYHEEILQLKVSTSGGGGVDTGDDDDPLIWEAADAVVGSGLGSTSMLQRRLKVGYARAGRIMDMLESKGVVGPPDGSKPREVLIDEMELETLKAFERSDGEE